ncbi:hypothetical protein AAH991_36385 [Microbispora sp. ZYX-F-249]|uniref:Uncharacterized protein n=1 Tax=Microbispora maris TaxID=3144104 RepID=A0ABV0AZF1_9ACTN
MRTSIGLRAGSPVTVGAHIGGDPDQAAGLRPRRTRQTTSALGGPQHVLALDAAPIARVMTRRAGAMRDRACNCRETTPTHTSDGRRRAAAPGRPAVRLVGWLVDAIPPR